MTPDLSDLTSALLDAARKAGAEAADALAVSGTALSIEIRKGALETAERSEGVEIGLRVLIGRRQTCVSASDTARSGFRSGLLCPSWPPFAGAGLSAVQLLKSEKGSSDITYQQDE